jgi:hypothetical protein
MDTPVAVQEAVPSVCVCVCVCACACVRVCGHVGGGAGSRLGGAVCKQGASERCVLPVSHSVNSTLPTRPNTSHCAMGDQSERPKRSKTSEWSPFGEVSIWRIRKRPDGLQESDARRNSSAAGSEYQSECSDHHRDQGLHARAGRARGAGDTLVSDSDALTENAPVVRTSDPTTNQHLRQQRARALGASARHVCEASLPPAPHAPRGPKCNCCCP